MEWQYLYGDTVYLLPIIASETKVNRTFFILFSQVKKKIVERLKNVVGK